MFEHSPFIGEMAINIMQRVRMSVSIVG